MSEPKDMVMPMLREIRKEIKDGFRNVDDRFAIIDKRLENIESTQKSFRQALTADTMMSKFITGDFEERIEALEKKIDGLLKAPRA
jgi:prefoldin subunit 5